MTVQNGRPAVKKLVGVNPIRSSMGVLTCNTVLAQVSHTCLICPANHGRCQGRPSTGKPELAPSIPGEGCSSALQPGHAIIISMEVGNIRFYKDRWQAVEEIERQELRAMTVMEHWQKLNAIVRFVLETGMEIKADDSETEVFRRWAKLKSDYEA